MTEIITKTPTIKSKLVRALFYPEWTFNINDKICNICKNANTSICEECQTSKTEINQDICPFSKGKCGHGFHRHCINKWLEEGGGVCPSCRTPWTFMLENIDKTEWKESLIHCTRTTTYKKIKQEVYQQPTVKQASSNTNIFKAVSSDEEDDMSDLPDLVPGKSL